MGLRAETAVNVFAFSSPVDDGEIFIETARFGAEMRKIKTTMSSGLMGLRPETAVNDVRIRTVGFSPSGPRRRMDGSATGWAGFPAGRADGKVGQRRCGAGMKFLQKVECPRSAGIECTCATIVSVARSYFVVKGSEKDFLLAIVGLPATSRVTTPGKCPA